MRWIRLVRVRGQEQIVKNRFFSRIIYNYYTDRIICAAKCVEKRFLFPLNQKRKKIIYYGKSFVNAFLKKDFHDPHLSSLLDFSKITFLILGRFDPVKGHEKCLDSYIHYHSQEPSQMIWIGKNESLNAIDIINKKKDFFESIEEENHIIVAKVKNQNKKIIVINKYCDDAFHIMQHSHFGSVSSLSSEVICRVAVEFLHCSVPVLYSKVGALPEVLEDFPHFGVDITEDSFLFETLFQHAEKLFQDKKAYEELKQKCKKVAESKYSSANYALIFDPW
jgi:glycosyltransferase involved in cell wall biosynthesis